MKHSTKSSLLNKRLLFSVCVFFFISNTSVAQQFNVEKSSIIFDNIDTHLIPTVYTIEVKDIPKAMDSVFGLEKICFHIKHKRPTDLKIELSSPNGTSVWISNRNGGGNTYGYLNTCVVQNGFDGSLSTPNYYFQGEYSAEGRLEFFNQNINPNGIWNLTITDLENGVIGKLESASIFFGDNPAKYDVSPCNLESSQNCHTSDINNRLLPNLIVSKKLTSDNIRYFGPEDPKYPNQLRFAAAMANIGEGPLHVITSDNWYCGEDIVDEKETCKDGSTPINSVQQVIYQKESNNSIIFDTIKAGTMYFDNTPGHNHYHVSNWADFKILKKCRWSNDQKKWDIIASSNKISYCLFDNKSCTNENQYCISHDIVYSTKNLKNYGLGTFSSCNSKEQGISVGGIDYYGMYYEGQQIDLPSDMPSGEYYLFIEVDPHNEYLELNEEDNSILIPFNIK